MSKSETESNVTVRDMEILNEIRNYIRRKINNANGNYYYEIWPQKKEILDLMRKSVEMRESNSVIVCGPPGCGKTALVDSVIEELRKENVADGNAFVIRLNGLLHTDDRLALKDVTRQLKLAEEAGTARGESPTKVFSFQENLIRLLDKFKERSNDGMLQPCIIFLLDEFHLFCGHKNQILLYNLFDVAQSAKSPIFVLGLTHCTDVMDLMEKRVLSRFSHRLIWLNQNESIEERLKMFKNIFTLKHEDLPDVDEIYKVLWNMRIDDLIENNEVVEALKRQLEIVSSQTQFRNLMFKLFNTITFELPLLTAESVKSIFSSPDYYVLMLSCLSMLEMALIIAIKNQTVAYEKEPFNFEMIYLQYLKLSKQNSAVLVGERSVAWKGFQRLQELEIIVPAKKNVGNALGKVPPEYQLHNFNLTNDQVVEGAKLNKELTMDLRHSAISGSA